MKKIEKVYLCIYLAFWILASCPGSIIRVLRGWGIHKDSIKFSITLISMHIAMFREIIKSDKALEAV